MGREAKELRIRDNGKHENAALIHKVMTELALQKFSGINCRTGTQVGKNIACSERIGGKKRVGGVALLSMLRMLYLL